MESLSAEEIRLIRRDRKLVLLGETQVGKTSLFNRIIDGEFKALEKPTIGCSHTSKEVQIPGKDASLELIIWDTAGQERFRGLSPMYYRSADMCLVVFDVSARKTFSGVGEWVSDVRKYALNECKIIIVANKRDLESIEVDSEEARRLAEDLGCMYTETSALTGAGVRSLVETIAIELDPSVYMGKIVGALGKKKGLKGCC
jgi:small GTP-binding protein